MMKAMPESVKKGTGFRFCFIQIIGISSSLDGSLVYIISENWNFFFFSPVQGEKKVVESGGGGIKSLKSKRHQNQKGKKRSRMRSVFFTTP